MRGFIAFLAFAFVCLETTQSTKFEKCGGKGENKNALCFKAQLKEISVQMGNDGTDDDVTMEICSDVDATQCCKTPPLKSRRADDWSRNDKEDWDSSYFGDQCKKQVFKVRNSLLVTLSLAGDDSLKVKQITITTKSPDKNDKETESFQCGVFNLATAGNKQKKKLKTCKIGPYNYVQVDKAVSIIGNAKGDGTDNDVFIKICSDLNTTDCCTQKLSTLTSDDWSRGDTETWETKRFKDCGKRLYKARTRPIISISRQGKDDLLKVTDFKITFDIIDTPVKKIVYDCDGFQIKGPCKTQAACTQPLICTSKRPGSASQSQIKPKTKSG